MDESRKAFEAWFMDDVVGAAVDFPEFEDGEYVTGEVYDEQLYVMLQAMYMAWTASRAAIEIELPRVIDAHPLGPQSAKMICAFHKNVVGECAKAIRAAGIKVKE